MSSTKETTTKTMTIKITDYSDEILEKMEEEIKTALNTCGVVAEDYAKKKLTEQGAVDTGNLRNSVTHEVKGDTMYVGTNVEYAPYIEYGTSKMVARPYIKPAVADNVEKFQKIFKHQVDYWM